MSEQFLTADELVQRWNGAVNTGTLANWRSKKKGPAFTKFGANVRYPLAAVIEYERANIHSNDNTEAIKGAQNA